MTKRLVALFGTAVLVLAACGPAATTPPQGTPGPGQTTGPAPTGTTGGLADDQTLRLYLSATDPPAMNPQLASDSVSLSILNAIHRGLMYFDADLKAVPALAADFPAVSDGGSTLTFTLREANYADGSRIVAGDFVRGFQRLLDPRSAAPYSYIACDIAGANALLGTAGGCPGDNADALTDPAAIDAALEPANLGVEAPDDSTVIVRLAQPATYFTTIMAMWVAVPVKEDWTAFAEASDLGASGPFMVDSWDHNSEIVLVPNPEWYGTPPTLQRVVLSIGGDPEAALAAFEQGEFDSVVVPGTSIRRVEQDPNLQPLIRDEAQLAITYYNYATCGEGQGCLEQAGTADGMAATANRNFRIALTHAVNKQQFIDLTFGGIGPIANGMTMPGIPGYDADYNPYPYDPAAAQAAMATALTELGVTDTNGDGEVSAADLGTMRFGYNCDAGHLPRVAFLAEAWRTTFGLGENQFDISCTDFATFLNERGVPRYHVARNGWGADFPHAKNQLDLFVCGSGNNDSQYCNPEFERLFNQAATEADPATQEQLYIQAQRVMVDDAGALFLRFGLTRYLVQPYLGGLTSTPGNYQNIGDNFYENIQILEH